MAERRMFAKTIIDSDAFLEMPQSTQLLYFHLSMRADDDGFINNPKSIMRNVGCKEDDMRILSGKKFIIPFESGVVVIKHWKIHNYIQKDRYHETKYKEELATLDTDENGSYTKCIQNVSIMDTQVRLELGKDRLGEERKEESPENPAPFSEKLYSSESYILANLLSELHIQNIDSKCKPITPKQNQAWAKDIEMIERIDGRSYQDIEKAIRWIKTPGQFWAPNIMSGSKLREKFPTIWAQMSQRNTGYSKPELKVNQRTTMLDLEE